jgi:3-oxoacyl-[acyl-carrier-protein] synthase II
MRRVVITGVGLLSAAGNSPEALWANCIAGNSGIDRITLLDPTEYPSQIAGEVKDFEPDKELDPKLIDRSGRFCQMALVAVGEALKDAGLGGLGPLPEKLRTRTAVVFGSGIGGLDVLEEQHRRLLERGPRRVSPFFVPMIIADMAAGLIAIETCALGPNYCVVTACASSVHSIGSAFREIQLGAADLAIAGGTEAVIVPTALAGFCSAKALSRRNDDPKRACRPFDRDRDGFVIAEGACCVILEELQHALSRGARAYAEIAGYGTSGDGYHMTAPRPDGLGAVLAMRAALRDAGIEPAEVDYVNAHAPGTQDGDATEANALEQVFGEAGRMVSVSSTKPIHGHQLGATGATELVICLMAMRDGVVPPTINCENPEREYGFDLVRGEPKERKIRVAMTNSFGFGGHNAVLVVKAV